MRARQPRPPRRPVRRDQPTRPQPWQWALTASIALGSVAGGIASNILTDLVNRNFGTVTWVTGSVAVATAGVLAALEVRSHRARGADRGAEPPPPVPVQPAGVPTDLPYTSGFIGRRTTVDWIADAVRAEHAVALIGRRAVGTSACVVQAANAVRSRYPDGQLYLDLRQAGRPLRPREVLDALCRKVGIDDATLAATRDLDAAAALLRAELGDRKALLVVDNVTEPAQVRPLLPPAAQCRLLMAGTGALAGLDGVRVRQLTEPPTDEAVELFAAAARDAGSVRRELRTDPAVRELVELAGRQPHAVRVLGWRLAGHGWSPRELLVALREAMAVPTGSAGRGDATVRLLAGRDRAYQALSGGGRRLYRLLALVRQPLSRTAIAALCGAGRARVDRLLDEVVAGAFVIATPDGRYRLRPLLADYARIHLVHAEPPRRQVAACARLVRHLARRAERHAEALSGGTDEPASGSGSPWFARHEALLRTVACGDWGSAGALPADPPLRVTRWWLRLAVALCTWYAARGRLEDWAAVCRAVRASPLAHDRPAVAGWAHNELGAVHRWQGDPHGAAVELTRAVALRHRRGAAQSRTNLGLALLDQHDVDGALDQLQRARRQRSPRDRAGQALTELGLGAAFLARGDPAQGRHHLILAANRFDTIGDRRGYAAALTNLALAQWWLGERLDAAHAWHAALDCHPAVNDRHGHAAALLNAGAVLLAEAGPYPGASPPAAAGSRAGTGFGGRDRRVRAARAQELLTESLRLRRAASRPVGRTLLYLGDAAAAVGDTDEAKRCWA
ncbi:MAG: hypothetical protein QOE03_702, partial [Micromonosporaceae bacterium]|nr:hypothetical protein [Micromonosporaceae bacterium]